MLLSISMTNLGGTMGCMTSHQEAKEALWAGMVQQQILIGFWLERVTVVLLSSFPASSIL